MSSFLWFCLATALEFLAGCGCWWLSHRDFKKCKQDPLAPVEVGNRARAERRLAFLFFVASILTAVGLYVSRNEQQKSDAELAGVTNELGNLRKSNRELEAKANPRTITALEKERFLNISTNWIKSPVKVFVGKENGEADAYASQIRLLLNEANYGTQGETIVRMYDCDVAMSQPYPWPDGVSFGRMPVLFVLSSTNSENIDWPGIRFQTFRSVTNTITGTWFSYDDPRAVPAMISAAFGEMGIPTMWVADTNCFKAGEWGIFISPRFF